MLALVLVIIISCLFTVSAFTSAKVKLSPSVVSKTQVYEDFKLDFDNPTVYSDKRIFSEKQLREYTAQYSVDRRDSILDFFGGLFKKEETTEPIISGRSNVAEALKPTVSPAVLEEKTGKFVQGKINAKEFAGVLAAAFGPKLSSVLPGILSSLPAAKAKELSKFAK